MSDRFHWARLLAFVTGLVNQELLLRNEYLGGRESHPQSPPAHPAFVSRIRSAPHWPKSRKRLGRKALKDIAGVAKPDTILAWYRRLVAQKFDGSRQRQLSGPPAGLTGSGSAGGPFCTREPGLGIRPHRGRAGESGSSASRIEPWAISCADTTLHQHPTGAARRRGRSSSGRIWTCWPELTSSRVEVLTLAGTGDVLRSVLH